MSIEVIKSGILDTIQDMGRYGYATWGINPGGAMDRYAAQVANALVGNDPDEAVVEIHYPGGKYLFQKAALIALTGGDFTPHINDTPISAWKTLAVKEGSVLSFHHKTKGARCYLSVHGGFNLPLWLNSYATNLKISAGGFNGRRLKKSDLLPVGTPHYLTKKNNIENGDFFELPWSVNVKSVYDQLNRISFVEGNEWKWLTPDSQEQILTDQFRIDPSSDRMAYHLQHKTVKLQQQEELLSSAVSFGTIQVLPNGNLIVLMADHQTTGGYPRAGHIITSHLPKLSQLGAHDTIQLNKISLAAAEKMLFSLMQELSMLHSVCRQKLDHYYAHN